MERPGGGRVELYNTHCLMTTYIVSSFPASQDIKRPFIMKSDMDYATKITRNYEYYGEYLNA